MDGATTCHKQEEAAFPFHPTSLYESVFSLVIQTLKDVDPTRKCFRMVGGVLVERTVNEVLPALVNNHEQVSFKLLTKVLFPTVENSVSLCSDLVFQHYFQHQVTVYIYSLEHSFNKGP